MTADSAASTTLTPGPDLGFVIPIQAKIIGGPDGTVVHLEYLLSIRGLFPLRWLVRVLAGLVSLELQVSVRCARGFSYEKVCERSAN